MALVRIIALSDRLAPRVSHHMFDRHLRDEASHKVLGCPRRPALLSFYDAVVVDLEAGGVDSLRPVHVLGPTAGCAKALWIRTASTRCSGW